MIFRYNDTYKFLNGIAVNVSFFILMIVNRDDYDRRRWSELFKREPRDKEDFYSLTRKKALRKISEEPFGYTVFNDYSSTACCAAVN